MDLPPFLREHCKLGEGENSCRYLMVGAGWSCAKVDPGVKAYIDKRSALDRMEAKGDHCEGIEKLQERVDEYDRIPT